MVPITDARVSIVAKRIARAEYQRRHFKGAHEDEFVRDWWHLYIRHAQDAIEVIVSPDVGRTAA